MTVTWNGADTARLTLRELKAEALETRKQLGADRDAIGRHIDPHLNDVGLTAKRAELREKAGQVAADRLTNIDSRWTASIQRIRDFAHQHRATVTNDPIQLQRMSVAWDTVRRLIDNGRPLHTLLAETTSTDVLLAIREWAPDYLRASGDVGDGFNPATLGRTVDVRIAELKGGDAADAYEMLREAESLDAGWRLTRDHATADALGGATKGTSLEMAVAALAAEQATAATYRSASSLADAVAQRSEQTATDQQAPVATAS